MLTVAGIIAVVAVVNAVLPSVGRTTGAMTSTADVIDNRLSSQVEIVHATGQSGATVADAWVKNVGATVIEPLDKIDLFFGPEGDFTRIPYGGASCSAPCWEYTLENDTEWKPTATLHIIIHLGDALETNTVYYTKVVAPNGSTDAKFFTV
jgi:flagellar protein FlaG